MVIVFIAVIGIVVAYEFLSKPQTFATESDSGLTYNVDENPSAAPQVGPQQATNITSDRSTWPSGDRIWSVCQAIAVAEGYGQSDSNPNRLNNPGDISDGAYLFSQESHSGSNVTHFPDALTGWNWLYDKIQNASQGKSHVFLPSMTWTQFAKKWAADWQNWVTNVTNDLQEQGYAAYPDSTIGEYFNG